MSALLEPTAVVLRAALADAQHAGRLPSVVAGVVRDGELVWSGARGRRVREDDDARADADVQYRIGSVTKTFTAAMLLQLREDGLLELDDPVGRHVPEGPYADATLRDLLAHGGGLPAEPRGPWWERSRGGTYAELVARHADGRRVLPVGESHHYSNLGYAVLGEVVARRRGAPWAQVLAERVLAPLGMTRTTYGPVAPHADGWSVEHLTGLLHPEPHQDTGAMAPAGQLWSTVADLARWVSVLVDGAEGVLSADSVRAMATSRSAYPDEGLSGAYGLGLRLAGPGPLVLVGHSGSMPGFVCGAWTDRASGLGAVVLSNGAYGLDVEGLPRRLLATVLEQEPPEAPEWVPPTAVPDAVRELLGTWYWGNLAFEARHEDGSLRLASSGRGFDFRPDGPDTMIGTSGYQRGETLRVVRRPDGTVHHLDVGTFCYTRTPYDPSVDVPGAGDERR